ncbi:MAG: hypothetical protein WBR18_01895 [Anaerolineales bacterium]
MGRVESYRQKLASLDEWDSYLQAESHLPGPRANLELSAAYAELADPETIWQHAEIDADEAPENTPESFLAVCGTRALGRLVLGGDRRAEAKLRTAASDTRWRCREAVAMALQTIGEEAPERLVSMVAEWSGGNRYEQRAAVAAICEPALLRVQATIEQALEVLNTISASIKGANDRRHDDFRTLRKTLGYGWSVVIAANPEEGKLAFERWVDVEDPDIRWMVRRNLGKARLRRMDEEWVESLLKRTAS